jgi:peptide/nickel transport system substrate-binding protein
MVFFLGPILTEITARFKKKMMPPLSPFVYRLLCGAVALAVAGLFASDAPAKPAADTLVMAVQSGASSLDARQATDASSSRLLKLITLALVRLDDRLHPQPEAAERIAQPDPLTYTATLRPLTFHDGTALTSAHVKALYDSILDPATGSPLRGLLLDIDRIDTPSDREIVFRLKKPNPFFWNMLLRPIVKLTPDVAQRPVGLGPYRVDTLRPDGGIELERAATWQGPQPPLKRLVFAVVPDPVVRVLKLESGEADLLQNDLPDSLYDYALRQGLKGLSAPGAQYSYIGFNFTDPVTGNPAVRRAVSHAIDRARIVRTLLGGRADEALSLLPPAHSAFWPAPPPAYNPDEARRLLDAAGLKPDASGVRFKLVLSAPTNPSTLLLAQVIQQQLREVGIDLRLALTEWGTFYGTIKKGNFQAFMLTWVGLFQPDIYSNLFHSGRMPPVGANRGRYQNPTMDALINDLMTDPRVQTERAVAIQKQQAADLIYVPLWRRHNMALMRPVVDGFTLRPDGSLDGLLTTRKTAP